MGSIGEGVALRVHEAARGADGFGADAEDGGLARGADPEVALVKKEVYARVRLAGWGRAWTRGTF